MTNERKVECPDCDSPITRRSFVQTVGTSALFAGVYATTGYKTASAAPTADSAAETTVGRFYDSLSETQRKEICFGFNHKKRSELDANWQITKPRIGDDFYTDAQRKLIDDIIRNVASEDGYERFSRQMASDIKGGVNAYSVAVFGKPGTGEFQWELTGRHLTLRADGDSVKNMAFGGPIVYGHGASDPAKNLFHYQTKQANQVFQALDPKQAKQALLESAPIEYEVDIQGDGGKFPGIAVGELSSDQQQLVEDTIKVMLAPYRSEDVAEVMEILKNNGGLKKLHLAFYKEDDLKNDQVWDIWRVEGPAFAWHFRGAPHVHTYVNIGVKAS